MRLDLNGPNPFFRRTAPVLLALAAAAITAACVRKVKLWPPQIQFAKHKIALEVRLAHDMNNQSPLAVDMVAVSNKALYKELKKTTAQDWFAQRKQHQLDYVVGHDFELFSWEWTPGQKVGRIEEKVRRKTRGVLVFANYAEEGAHRARLKPKRAYWLDFQEKGFRAKRLKGGGDDA